MAPRERAGDGNTKRLTDFRPVARRGDWVGRCHSGNDDRDEQFPGKWTERTLLLAQDIAWIRFPRGSPTHARDDATATCAPRNEKPESRDGKTTANDSE